MSGMNQLSAPRLTPWVTRLTIVNGAVLLLLATVFTAPRFFDGLMFDPARFTDRPWTVLTYAFVHGNILHLALNVLAISLFGPPVERKLGSGRFVAYYLYCAIGAALVALAFATVARVDPFIGSSGAVYGVAVAYVLFWPEARLTVFPLSVTASARTLFLVLLAVDSGLGLWGRDGVAHFVHLGGAVAGYVFFRLQLLGAKRTPARPVPAPRRPVVTPMRVEEAAQDSRSAPPAAERIASGSDDAEVDRLLDKISQTGLQSLTSQERKLLSEASERKRREQH